MSATVTVGDTTVACAPEQTVLDALLRSGVWMPNSCNQGTCGTCKIRVRSGAVDHRTSPEATLPATERDAGFALACQATPCGDTVVERPRTDDGRDRDATHALRDLVGTVTEVRDIAHDTRRMLLTLDTPLEFSAGQYVELTVPGTGVRRQYSLANTPGEAKLLELHVRRRPGGVASDRWAFGTVAVGDRVDVTGPLGDFTFDAESTGPMVLLAGGTGLAPMKSIVRQALSLDPRREIVLYHGVRTAEDLYDSGFFRELEAQHPGFRFVACLSRESGGDREGYAPDAFVEDVASAKEYTGYICGSEAFVDSAVKACKRRRMSPRRIRREKFTSAT
ncbi:MULTISPECIES: 2Fe-2S iron-sulfur cluster-binding protein [Rhodococcus]|jgi:CDP-4-dehydro-6-deoxyglucose reductase/3-phenylpropionate/trans-cinnamate dioxygenase ferredoxin reductase subunit/phenol hydroxylase P5 protein|uniref:2Fe-2S iron-sulfur cluster-binding protein n=1 Tax=Rhodococcus aetherivorans TaxID=191292 RepID=N1MDL8_9NOCA|nr:MULTISPECIES: 2Fe-2S iron-sulfur cluster-binding protein [Rhodococcus]AKE91865.1 oxidoreductase [Rhodococcus aetherivorans]ANZ23289.1 oxidoreductase [Rhodococcus sp. WB1]MBC2589797.1 2Fe-2S iron-sulfur cluster binding domain-containing protein [Rhodococcus aetherivorans]OLL19439.1 oxidoreductase [Rhodococcus sp. M8]QIX52495.1 2Fe-2S iron-sulfur cluster binding domain-containing protein [Rhodococcus sp. DMU1]